MAMRRELFRMSRPQALELLARAPVVHLATTTPDGAPVLRAVHGVMLAEGPEGPAVAFHGAPAGEKADCIGRPCVLAADGCIAGALRWFERGVAGAPLPARVHMLKALAHHPRCAVRAFALHSLESCQVAQAE